MSCAFFGFSVCWFAVLSIPYPMISCFTGMVSHPVMMCYDRTICEVKKSIFFVVIRATAARWPPPQRGRHFRCRTSPRRRCYRPRHAAAHMHRPWRIVVRLQDTAGVQEPPRGENFPLAWWNARKIASVRSTTGGKQRSGTALLRRGACAMFGEAGKRP